MKAAQSFGIDDIRYVSDAPDPEPLETDAVVKTEMSTLCGSDLHMVCKGWQMPEYPAPPGHPGHEGVGIVVETPERYPSGDGIDELEPGDLVLTVPHIWYAKCFAEYQAVDAAHLLKLPAGPPVAHLMMTQQLGTVIFATRRLPESLRGMTCAVLGQGSAGLFWNTVLKRRGAERVIALEPVDSRRSLSTKYGADETLNVTGEDARDAVYDLTDGKGADIVIEAVGSTPTLSNAFQIVADEGTCVLFGLPDSNDPVPFDYTEMFKKRANAYSILGAQEEPGLKTFRRALSWIVEGEIDMAPIVTHMMPIEEVSSAFALSESRGDGVVKVALTF